MHRSLSLTIGAGEIKQTMGLLLGHTQAHFCCVETEHVNFGLDLGPLNDTENGPLLSPFMTYINVGLELGPLYRLRAVSHSGGNTLCLSKNPSKARAILSPSLGISGSSHRFEHKKYHTVAVAYCFVQGR